MDGADSEEPARAENSNDAAGAERELDERHAEADRAAEGLRDQIAALRQRVRDAQDTLRKHQRRADERRSFKG
jgi:hypothetical protein